MSKENNKIDEVDRVAFYNEDPRMIHEFGQYYPDFPSVIAKILHIGIEPEKITRAVILHAIFTGNDRLKKYLDQIDRVCVYSNANNLTYIRLLRDAHPDLGYLVEDMLTRGISPEEITDLNIELAIEAKKESKANRENDWIKKYHKLVDLAEFLNPSNRVRLWEFGGKI